MNLTNRRHFLVKCHVTNCAFEVNGACSGAFVNISDRGIL